MAYEKDGFETAAVLSVLLAPGANTLRPVSLRAGASMLFVFQGVDGGPNDGGISDAGTGCEGFVDLERVPGLAACAGTFSGSLTGSGADALCSAGWHVCRHDDAQPRSVSYLAATGFPGCFSMRASTDEGDGCEPLDCSASNRDDIAGMGAGMGAGCVGVSGLSRPPGSVTTVGGCLADRGIINSQC